MSPLFPLLLLAALAVGPVHARPLNAADIGRIAGTHAQRTEDGVVRVTWPRTDVRVHVDGVALAPFAGLTSWAALTPMADGAMLMGDTVVFEDEVNPAIDAAFAHGLDVTGLHNHFFFDEPKVYFLHLGGQGSPEKLAAGVKAVWDAVKEVRQRQARPAGAFAPRPPKPGAVSPVVIERVLQTRAQTQDGMVKVNIGRPGRMHGVQVAGSMGLSTWAAFVGSDSDAIVAGDFIMTAEEVRPVLKALRRHGIHIVALHNHMLGETPAFYFTHFWGRGPAQHLAGGVRAALDAQTQSSATAVP